MAKAKRKTIKRFAVKEETSIQNLPPEPKWQSFDHFWDSCVKNGNDLIKESFRMHLKAMGWLSRPEKYIEGAIHFGIEIEK